MTDELLIRKLVGQTSPEPIVRVTDKQVLVKVLSDGQFDFGLRPENMSRFHYFAGNMILCRRNTEEWVRWHSSIDLLLITIPDRTLSSVAEEFGSNMWELEATPHLDDDRVRSLIHAVEIEHSLGYPAGNIFLSSMTYALTTILLRTRGKLHKAILQYTGGLTPLQLRRVTSFVYENIGKDISLAQMSEEASLSPAYFSQLFRQSTGFAPHQFVLRARVERAKLLLRSESSHILDVALACGFQTQQHFAKVFRGICGVSPSQYRRATLG